MLMDLCKDVRDKNSSGSRSRSRSRRGAVIIRADSLSTSGREEVAAGLCITAISFSIHSQKKILQAIESEKIPFKTISPTRAITRNRFPFTSTQWQELEHQALIYKYMVSGVPVPPELLYAVKRSLESSLASRLFPHQPSGWGCFQAGFGRKADPEPGRCRRTDGKKWRCSKEAYPDSKYCERHMHRGKSRSRKPVELTSSTPTTTATIPLINRNLSNPTVSPSSSSYSFSHPSSSAESEVYAHQNSSHRTFLYPHSSSSGPPESVFYPQNSTPHNLFLEPGSSPHADKQHRHYHGMREDVDERAFFPDGLVRARGVQDSYNQLPMSSYKGYSLPQFQTFADTSKEEQPQPGQHCFVLGTDIIKSSATRSIKLEKETETLKPLHHFFDQWEPKDADSWLDLASSSRPHTADD